MTITVCAVTPGFAAEVGDVDLSRPIDDADFAAIKDAFWKYAVLIFPEQHLTPAQHLAFSAKFGPVEKERTLDPKATPSRLTGEFADISNLAADGKIWGETSRQRMYKAGNKLWHTDSSFKRLPSLCSLLYSRSIAPLGGHTEFADQRAAYDALSDAMKNRLHGLIVEHWIVHSRRRSGFTEFNEEEMARLPPVPQALVRTIPQTGRKSLYVASHAGRVFGMPDAEGRALIDELIAHVTRREFVYTHRWRPNELVMWDNRCTMHRGTDYDDLRWIRDMQRVTISDIANSCEQEGIAVAA
ncbi:MAG: alpha-ketoglutarate-dependent 2,4-dichlorophenoxyacetate dioxygenase [Betaproteobacteria bacterium]|nr:alpha-ketoglutarate-dependent 2,4-dichlorophenoxyacetate dioxygenase [Betaproteobacteria bacterium]